MTGINIPKPAMVKPAITQPDAGTDDDPNLVRRGKVTNAPQPSSLPEADRAGEPGEQVLGGADGVPLGTDHAPKDETRASG